MTAFESHERTEQDNFFTLTLIWHAVETLHGSQQMTMRRQLWVPSLGKIQVTHGIVVVWYQMFVQV